MVSGHTIGLSRLKSVKDKKRYNPNAKHIVVTSTLFLNNIYSVFGNVIAITGIK